MPNALAALPIFYGLVFAPHALSLALVFSSNSRVYDNRNPRGTNHQTSISKTLGASKHAMWERSRAAHANGLEAFPLFAAALLAGMYTGAPDMERYAQLQLLLRLLYNVSYIVTTRRLLSYARTLIWGSATVSSLMVLYNAGMKTL